jgi:hypothetical protein
LEKGGAEDMVELLMEVLVLTSEQGTDNTTIVPPKLKKTEAVVKKSGGTGKKTEEPAAAKARSTKVPPIKAPVLKPSAAVQKALRKDKITLRVKPTQKPKPFKQRNTNPVQVPKIGFIRSDHENCHGQSQSHNEHQRCRPRSHGSI